MQIFLSFNTLFSGVDLLLHRGKNAIDVENVESKKQSEILVSSINNILARNNLDYGDISIFSTIAGPGNFTAIKTNLAVLKALQISTKAKIITSNFFEIISHGIAGHNCTVLDLGTIKYYISNGDEYATIYKKDIGEFLDENKNLRILTNDPTLAGDNVTHSEFTNQRWMDLVNYKFENGLFTDEITPLYIEEAAVTKRKSC